MKHNSSFTGLAQMLLFLMASVLLPVALLGCRTGPRPLRVFVASSFTAVAQDIAKEYAARYPNTTVDINVAGSGTLRDPQLRSHSRYPDRERASRA